MASAKDQDTDMDMNPMIDCVFLLMIFFVLVIDLSQKDLEDMILPKAEKAIPDENPPEQRPVINIAQNGLMVWKNQVKFDPANPGDRDKVTRAPLKLVQLLIDWKNQGLVSDFSDLNVGGGRVLQVVEDPILIRADKWTKWGFVGDFMVACSNQTAPYRKIELAMSEDDKEAKLGGN
ncbi:MAG: biopolymer transporter ExbD [Planctomycetota bacterium]